jgi:hypothetical protein
MKILKMNTGTPTDVFDGNPAISNSKLLLVNGKYARGNYSYVTNRWIIIEEFQLAIGDHINKDIIWFEEENHVCII